jgi:hypothetical protein
MAEKVDLIYFWFKQNYFQKIAYNLQGTQIFTNFKSQNGVQGSQIYHLFWLRNIFENGAEFKDGVWRFFQQKPKIKNTFSRLKFYAKGYIY